MYVLMFLDMYVCRGHLFYAFIPTIVGFSDIFMFHSIHFNYHGHVCMYEMNVYIHVQVYT